MRNFRFILIFLNLFLFSCHSVQDYHLNKTGIYLDCAAINQQISDLNRKKSVIESKNKFSLSNMMVLPSLIRTYKLVFVVKDIDEELHQLNNLKLSKNCKDSYRRKNNISNYGNSNYNNAGYKSPNYRNLNQNTPNYNNYNQRKNYNQNTANYNNVNYNNNYSSYNNGPNNNYYRENNMGNNRRGYNTENINYYNNNIGNNYGEYQGYGGLGADPIASNYLRQLR